MNERGKSDGPIVPRKPANNGVAARLDCCHPCDTPAERVEGRGSAKGNPHRGTRDRTQCRAFLHAALARIRREPQRLRVTTQGRSPVR